MSNRLINIIAASLLVFVFIITVFSIKDDSLTYDELSHIPSGYSYLTQRDYRMNPEHPPLIKDLAAAPLLFLNLNFPEDDPVWTQASPAVWWNQFDFGTKFLYQSGNDPDKIFFWARIPMIIILILFGWFIFFWAKKLWGKKAALITIFLFSFFPTFLAHGRLVTTDIGAAFGAILATYFWLEFLKNNNKKSLILAGLAFGIAMIIKFSLILILPFFAIITFVYAWLKNDNEKIKNLLKYSLRAFLAGLIGLVFVIWPIYGYHVSNYPPERQIKDTKDLLATTRVPESITKLNLLLESNSVTRPLGQYFLGILTATNRTATGNTTYFMEQISADSWRSYFPVVYFIKNPLPFHILTLIALLSALWAIKRPFWRNSYSRIKDWIGNHFTEFSMLSFLGIYWATSLASNLNIGVRHLMPVFPFTILLVSAAIANLLKKPFLKVKHALLVALLLWQTLSVFIIYPHFLAYFNEAVGGPNNGYRYVVDSNLDWGQDLKRLKDWVEEKGIDKIYLNYFGGGDPQYYLGNKYAPWWGDRSPEEFPKGNYLAVSVTLLQGGRGKPVPGFNQQTDYYLWLNEYKPVAKIGYSIFVYFID
jgi:hypothetical protein